MVVVYGPIRFFVDTPGFFKGEPHEGHIMFYKNDGHNDSTMKVWFFFFCWSCCAIIRGILGFWDRSAFRNISNSKLR